MEHDAPPSKPVVVEGLLFREYFIGRFSIGGNGLAVGRTLTPAPRARLTLGAQDLTAEILVGTLKGAFAPWTGGSWSYHEFEQAQVSRRHSGPPGGDFRSTSTQSE